MVEQKKFRGPWGQKFFIIVLTIVLGVLFYWLLGFVTRDIGTMKGPDRTAIREAHVDEQLVERRAALQEQLDQTKKKARNQQEQQRILKDTTNSLQNTMNQLLSIQRLSIEKDVDFSEESGQTLRESQAAFLENQKKYEAYNLELSDLMREQRSLEAELDEVASDIRSQERVADIEYGQLREKFRFKIAVIKLAVLLPIFLVTAFFFITKRTGAYCPIVYAAFIAAFIKVAWVSFEYFPRKYFKYIAILVLIAIVLRILIWLIRRIIAPKKEWLVKQYQQSYDKWICPVCSKPIRMGPLRYLAGMKKKGFIMPGGQPESAAEPYTCPSCGTDLFGQCKECEKIRHTLLPFCEHCGAGQ